VLCFHQLYDTECPAVDVLNNKTLFYTYRYSIIVAIHQTRSRRRYVYRRRELSGHRPKFSCWTFRKE